MKLICSSCSTIAKSSISEKFVGHIFGCTANQTTLDFNNGGNLPPCLYRVVSPSLCRSGALLVQGGLPVINLIA